MSARWVFDLGLVISIPNFSLSEIWAWRNYRNSDTRVWRREKQNEGEEDRMRDTASRRKKKALWSSRWPAAFMLCLPHANMQTKLYDYQPNEFSAHYDHIWLLPEAATGKHFSTVIALKAITSLQDTPLTVLGVLLVNIISFYFNIVLSSNQLITQCVIKIPGKYITVGQKDIFLSWSCDKLNGIFIMQLWFFFFFKA